MTSLSPAALAGTTLVCGPPCGGKTRYVADRAEPGDLIIDHDVLLSAISGHVGHGGPEALLPFAAAARAALLDLLAQPEHQGRRAWAIAVGPTVRSRSWYRRQGAQVVLVEASRETCRARARAERPGSWLPAIDTWFASAQRSEVDLSVSTEPGAALAPASPLGLASRRW